MAAGDSCVRNRRQSIQPGTLSSNRLHQPGRSVPGRGVRAAIGPDQGAEAAPPDPQEARPRRARPRVPRVAALTRSARLLHGPAIYTLRPGSSRTGDGGHPSLATSFRSVQQHGSANLMHQVSVSTVFGVSRGDTGRPAHRPGPLGTLSTPRAVRDARPGASLQAQAHPFQDRSVNRADTDATSEKAKPCRPVPANVETDRVAKIAPSSENKISEALGRPGDLRFKPAPGRYPHHGADRFARPLAWFLRFVTWHDLQMRGGFINTYGS